MSSLLIAATDYNVGIEFYDFTEVSWASVLLRITHSLLITATEYDADPCLTMSQRQCGRWGC